MEVNKEKIRYILLFFFDKGENASQAAEIVNAVYSADTVTANCGQFWFRRFPSGIFDVEDAPRTGWLFIENVDKITEIIEVDRHVSTRSPGAKYRPSNSFKPLAPNIKQSKLANRGGFVLHQDNDGLLTSVVTRQKLWELGWEVLTHPPYSPNLAPCDYHLFLALKNFLSDKKLGSREDCENRLLEFFTIKDQDSYEGGIMKLP
ncbi:histone-lysine N-methyltransferase SETMAR [Trichonephila clavipes]|uniref:Histone-lysine N-methyltransferase SETMAR n=1 Tax=Trichonephila clavipes TaxID=2585209 RepID=A0A8X6VX69_TRICX|nr:histone-lysine N-methyltransferase SETMAR [Trichonephila clavipes]